MDEPVTAASEGRPPRRRPWRLVVVGSVLAFLALLGWATVIGGQGRSLVSRIAAGEAPQAPDFRLEVVWPGDGQRPAELAGALADGELSLSELGGRPAVLNFWASWCIPCRDEAPILNAAFQAHRGDVIFVGINVQDGRSSALDFLREFTVPYVAVRDRSDDAYDAYGLTGVPETYYLDERGRIVAHTLGPITQARLDAGLAEALAGASRVAGG